MSKHYDVLVIGSGGGMKIALPAAAMGFKTALIEQDAVADVEKDMRLTALL